MGYDRELQKNLDQAHLHHPEPGDYWHEMYAPVARILQAKDGRVLVQKVSRMGGQEINDFDPKPRVMTVRSFAKWLSYSSIPGTWASVMPRKYPPEWIGSPTISSNQSNSK